jgi:hypothetical protein
MTRGTQVHLSASMGQTASNFRGYLNGPHKGCVHSRVTVVVLETVAINALDLPIRCGHVSTASGARHRFNYQYTCSK